MRRLMRLRHGLFPAPCRRQANARRSRALAVFRCRLRRMNQLIEADCFCALRRTPLEIGVLAQTRSGH